MIVLNTSVPDAGSVASAAEQVLPVAGAVVVALRPVEDPDRDLVSRAAGGDRGAFESLLRRYYDRIHRVAWRLTRS